MNLRASIRNGTHAVLEHVPFSVLRRVPGTDLLLPLYHAVTDSPPAHLKHLGCWRPIAVFQRDLDLLLQGRRPLGLEEVAACLTEGRPLPPRSFHLSIDDGLREAGEVIAPICLQKGVHATFFLTTTFLDNRMLGYRHLASLLRSGVRCQVSGVREEILRVRYCDRETLDRTAAAVGLDIEDYLRTARPYLERAEVQRLIAQGFTVGAHSVDHPPFAAISAGEQVRQVVESVRAVDAWFSPPIRTFAFPFTADGLSPLLFERVAREVKVDAYFGAGLTPPAPGQPVVDRIPMESKTHRSARAVLKEYYAKNIMRGLSKKLKN